jgi:Protein tyrosine and serine/threonine kinase
VIDMPRAATNLRTVIGHNPDGLLLVEALPILRDISTGLAQLAAANVVHRDLKPANILRHDNRWVIADFGIARHAATATSTHTHKSQFTPHYAAPEQWRNERTTVKTDIYAFGTTAHELLTGIDTHSGGGAGGMYLSNTIENLTDGAIGTYFEAGDTWPEWGPIPISHAGLAPAGAPLAVVMRREKDEDLFVVDKRGSIGWTPMRNGPWGPTQQITQPDTAPVGGWLAAVARHDEHIDVFFIDKNGALWSLYGPATWILFLSHQTAGPTGPNGKKARRAGKS